MTVGALVCLRALYKVWESNILGRYCTIIDTVYCHVVRPSFSFLYNYVFRVGLYSLLVIYDRLSKNVTTRLLLLFRWPQYSFWPDRLNKGQVHFTAFCFKDLYPNPGNINCTKDLSQNHERYVFYTLPSLQ